MNINALLETISLIIINTPIEQKEIVRRLRYVLVHTARKEFPEMSIASLSSIIGILRGKISETLEEEPPRIPISSEAIILNILWKKSDNDNEIPIKGDNSYYSVAKPILVGRHSPETALNTLIKSGCVEFSGNGLLIKTDKFIIESNIKDSMRIANGLILKLMRTVLYNTDPDNNNKKYQRSFSTNSIHPKNINDTHLQVFDYLENTVMIKIREIVESYEDDNIYDYPEYTVSLFENF